MRARRCVRTHTHRLHVWQVTRCMEHGSFIFEHEFYLFEHELKRIMMLEGYSSHTNLTNRYERHWHTELLKRVAHGSHSHGFLMQGRIDEMKRLFRNQTFSCLYK